jgi:hypothetical protein
MSPHRQATEKQLAALVKARAALAKKHTCERCGAYDPSHGLQQDDGRIYTIMRDGVAHRYCISCQLYFQWIDTRERIEQQLHTLFAEHTPFYLLDLETTGKLESRSCQVVEIAVVNQGGQVLYQSLCKPDIPMPAEARDVNGITNVIWRKICQRETYLHTKNGSGSGGLTVPDEVDIIPTIHNLRGLMGV